MGRDRFAGIFAVLVLFLLMTVTAFIFVQGSISPNDVRPKYSDCITDSQGNIPSCTWDDEQVSDLQNGFTSDTAKFRVRISDVETHDESQAPYVLWLWKNDYRVPYNGEDFQNRIDDVGPEDVNRSKKVIESLEMASTCSLNVDVASHGETTVTTSTESQVYNDEPDTDERHSKHIMPEAVTVEADSIDVRKRYVICRFDMAEILDSGMELSGEFEEWSGRDPVVGDMEGASSAVSLSYSVDSNGDGVLDAVEQESDNQEREQENGQEDGTDSGGSESEPSDSEKGFWQKLIDALKQILSTN